MPPRPTATLEIRILDQQDDGYPVELMLESTIGRQEFHRGYLDPTFLPWLPSDSACEDGERLFDWLFANKQLRIDWAEARGKHPARRILLRLDAHAPELHTIPWELLRDTTAGNVSSDLASSTQTPFSRYLAHRQEPGTPTVEPTIKVLVAIASPDDLDEHCLSPIDINMEWSLLQEAIAELDVELTLLPQPCTLSALEAALHQRYQILHFIGHGAFSDEEDRAFLYMANKENKLVLVYEDKFAAMLQRQRSQTHPLRFIFLDSCQTATRSAADAFRGFAPQLVNAGIPAVLAMQDLIDVETARAFTHAFYQQLLQHGQVDLACNQARSTIITTELPGSSIPVFFSRLPNGKLFDVAQSDDIAKTPTWLAALTFVILLIAVLSTIDLFGLEVTRIFTMSTPAPLFTSVPNLVLMTGDFNIAVAEFGVLHPEKGTVESSKGHDLAETVFATLSTEVQKFNEDGFKIEVLPPSSIGHIKGFDNEEWATNVENLAKEINADIVIFGNLMFDENLTSLSPYYYLSNAKLRNAEEFGGVYKFGSLIQTSDNINNNMVASRELRTNLTNQTVDLVQLIIGIGYFVISRYDDAELHFQKVSENAKQWDGNSQAIRYLFLGGIAGKRDNLDLARKNFELALSADSENARILLNLSQIYFLLARNSCQPNQVHIERLKTAEEGYNRVLRLQQAPHSDIPTKVAFALANLYLCLSQAQVADHWDDAEIEFKRVIQTFAEGNKRIRYLAAKAHAGLGFLYLPFTDDPNPESAYYRSAEEFKKATELSLSPDDQAVNLLWLSQIYLYLNMCKEVDDYLSKAETVYDGYFQLNLRTPHKDFEAFRDNIKSQVNTLCPTVLHGTP